MSRMLALNGFMQLAHKVLLALCYESVWLHNIDVFFKIIVQELCLNIHLPHLVIKMCHNGWEYSNGIEHGY